jgi:hydrogenase maturation protease
MNLLDLILGYDKAIIIDAINIKNANDGDVKRFLITDFSTVHSNNPHDVSLIEALKLAEHLGEKRIPNEIIIIGIVLRNIPHEFGDKLSKKIAAAIPKAVELTLTEFKNNNENINSKWSNDKLT